MLTFSHDKERLHTHFEKEPYLFGYHLGDLDDFYFPHCQWMVAYLDRAHIEEAVLVYTGLDTPTVLAFGLSDLFGKLMNEAVSLFPDRFFGHYQENVRDILRSLYSEKPLGTHLKMVLRNFKPSDASSGQIARLDQSHRDELQQLYDLAYPGNYFTARMLETGKYIGWLEDDRIVSAAGVHVYSPRYNMAVLGNIATDPDYRGRGLAAKVTSHLSRELVEEGIRVTLNVHHQNGAAIGCYESLGFVTEHKYEEGYFELRG